MSRPKLLAFIVMLAIFIPLIAVPEIEENPFSHPTYYENQTTPIKDYDIISELKALEKEGIATAVFQPEMNEFESLSGVTKSTKNQIDTIRTISALQSNSITEDESLTFLDPDLDDDQLRSFLEEKLQRFKEANLNPSYFIVPDVTFRHKISTILDEITAQLQMPKIELIMKNDAEELSTDLLVFFESEARKTAVENQDEINTLFERYVRDYLENNYRFSNNILTIDVQHWDDTTSWCLGTFLNIIETYEYDYVIRIENISMVTSPDVFKEIITVCQSAPESTNNDYPIEEADPGTRGNGEVSIAQDKAGSSDTESKERNEHVQEIIVGATPESSDYVSVEEEKFTLVIDVINGFYYVILLTCLLPNIFFVAWAGFIRRERRQFQKSQKAGGNGNSGQNSITNPSQQDHFDRKLHKLEHELGHVILSNDDSVDKHRLNSGELDKSIANTKSYTRQRGKKWPDVTIILPCFNEQKGLALAVERCYNQNYPGRIEILIVDDGSKDYTLKIAKIFEGPFPDRTVRAFHKPNGGKADALNFGIKRATGQIILTTDGDSHMDQDAVTSLVKGYMDNPHAGVVGGFVVIRNEKDSMLVKCQQIEYIFTQDVFRLPQSESANVLIIPGPVFSMGGRVAKTHEASTRTCVEDADLTHTILKDNWGTVATTDATAHTQAPTTWKAWFKQRKRWVYGQFQVWRENKSFLKRNFWGLYSYFTWFSAVLITSMLITSILALAFIGEWNFFTLLITAQTTVIFAAYFITRGISLARYKYGRRLVKYLPLQVFYDMVNGVLCAYLYMKYITGRGVKIKFGPELVRIR